ncbi:MAG TPA: MBOAT family O-acyltransferase [Bacteroidales bacterium]|nr:MBOAT family O-acyltransferase [Bacteroidales bacterium]HPS46366.1 MBOAT family O-acyltransferase [Bacteroidales bacterium]
MSDFFNALLYHPEHPLVFYSVLFFVLFSSFYIIYAFTSQSIKWRNGLLLLFSLYFYYKVSGIAIIFLLMVATSDFFLGKAIYFSSQKKAKKYYLIISLLINLGLLIFFKYTNFFIKIGNEINGISDFTTLNILLPIGISFYIFKSFTYIFDLYRGTLEKPEKNYFNYVLYVSFFPNILAGPISKASDLLPQIKNKLNINSQMVGKGFFLIMCGAFKKIVVADFLAGNLVNRVFDAPTYFSGFETLMASYGYMIQLFFDFSGYTDMVVGIACLLGFSIAPNFNKPFSATNITDFWRRWHMTLSVWLRDYLFSPLSLSFRKWGNTGIMLAVMITFLICGFWHGANYTFIIWGGLHGIAMAWDILTNKGRSKLKKRVNKGIYKFISIFITFQVLCFTFIIFRAKDVSTALGIYEKIGTNLDFSLAGKWMNLYIYPFLMMIFALLLHYTPAKWNQILENIYIQLHWSLKAIVFVVVLVVIYQIFSSQAQPFIYLEF